MRNELVRRATMASPQAFQLRRAKKAIRSQGLEGLTDPFAEEPPGIWDLR